MNIETPCGSPECVDRVVDSLPFSKLEYRDCQRPVLHDAALGAASASTCVSDICNIISVRPWGCRIADNICRELIQHLSAYLQNISTPGNLLCQVDCRRREQYNVGIRVLHDLRIPFNGVCGIQSNERGAWNHENCCLDDNSHSVSLGTRSNAKLRA